MALIICPECNKQISDQAEACPHCGYPLGNKRKARSVKINIAEAKRKRKIVFTIIGVICVAFGLAVLITCLILIKRDNDAAEAARQESVRQESIQQESIAQSKAEEAARIEAHNQYVTIANAFAEHIAYGAAQSNLTCCLTRVVWNNAIYKIESPDSDPYTKVNGKFVDDFNEALRALWNSESNQTFLKNIEENRVAVEKLYKALMNPPEEFEEYFATASKLYLVYREFTVMAMYPEGSLTSFSEDLNRISDEFRKLNEEMKILIPDYK